MSKNQPINSSEVLMHMSSYLLDFGLPPTQHIPNSTHYLSLSTCLASYIFKDLRDLISHSIWKLWIFSIFFRQNSLDSSPDQFFEYALFSTSPLMLPYFKSAFIHSPMKGSFLHACTVSAILLCAGIQK